MTEKTLKPGWKVWRFDQMAYEVKDRIDRPIDSGLDRYVGLEHLDTGSLKIWRWGSTSDVEKQKLLFKSGDIIFGRRNAYLRRVAVADFDGVCSAHAMVLRAHEDVVLPEFLPFFMQTDGFWEAALKVSAGSMSPTINWRNIAKEEFPLPPLDEQRRIADLLWGVDDVTEELLGLADTSLQLRKAIQENSLLDNNPGSEPFKQRLDAFFEINPSEPPLPADTPFFAMDTLDEWTREITRYDKKGSRGGVRARAGDILLARITPSLENGKTAIVPNNITRCGGSTEFIVIRGKNGISSDLAYWIVTSDSVRKIAIGLMHGTTGRQRVSANDFSSIKIKLSETQNINEIVKLLNSNYETYQTILNRIKDTKEFKKALLDKCLNSTG